MARINVFEASAELKLKDSKFTRGIAKSEGELRKFGRNIESSLGRHAGSSGVFARLGRSVTGLGSMLPAAGIALAGVGVAVAGVGAAVGGTVGKFAKFQSGMKEVFTLAPNMSARMRSKLERDIDQLAIQFGVLSEESIPAMYTAMSAGIPPDNVATFLEVATKAAKAGVTDLATSTEGLVGVMQAYNLSATEAARVSDAMFTAVRFGRTTFGELSSSIGQVAPLAAQLGIEYRELNALLAASTLVTGNTSISVTQLRATLAELSDSSKTAYNVFKDLTGDAFVDFQDKGGSVIEALLLLDEYTRANNQSIADLFGSIEADMFVLDAVKDKGQATIDIMDEMNQSAGSTDVAWSEMSDSLSHNMSVLRGNVDTVLKEIGGFFAPFVGAIAQTVATEVPDVVTAFTDYLRPWRTALISFFRDSEDDTGEGMGFMAKLTRAGGAAIADLWANLWAMVKWATQKGLHSLGQMMAPWLNDWNARFARWGASIYSHFLNLIINALGLVKKIPGLGQIMGLAGLDEKISDIENIRRDADKLASGETRTGDLITDEKYWDQATLSWKPMGVAGGFLADPGELVLPGFENLEELLNLPDLSADELRRRHWLASGGTLPTAQDMEVMRGNLTDYSQVAIEEFPDLDLDGGGGGGGSGAAGRGVAGSLLNLIQGLANDFVSEGFRDITKARGFISGRRMLDVETSEAGGLFRKDEEGVARGIGLAAFTGDELRDSPLVDLLFGRAIKDAIKEDNMRVAKEIEDEEKAALASRPSASSALSAIRGLARDFIKEGFRSIDQAGEFIQDRWTEERMFWADHLDEFGRGEGLARFKEGELQSYGFIGSVFGEAIDNAVEEDNRKRKQEVERSEREGNRLLADLQKSRDGEDQTASDYLMFRLGLRQDQIKQLHFAEQYWINQLKKEDEEFASSVSAALSPVPGTGLGGTGTRGVGLGGTGLGIEGPVSGIPGRWSGQPESRCTNITVVVDNANTAREVADEVAWQQTKQTFVSP